MNDWAWLVIILAAYYAWNANEKAEAAHALARDALYEAQSAKTRANEVAESVGQ